MSLYKYFSEVKKEDLQATPPSRSTLRQKEVDSANLLVSKEIERSKNSASRGKYGTYTELERARIGSMQQKMEQHELVSEVFKKNVPETTVRRLKCEYISQLNEKRKSSNNKDCEVSKLPTKPRGRPLLVGTVLDKAIQDYINALRSTGGVVNTSTRVCSV